MSLKKGLVLGIVMVLVMASASAALASSISIECYPTITGMTGVPPLGYQYGEEQDGLFSYQPATPGSFSLTGNGGSGATHVYWTTLPLHPFIFVVPPEPGSSLGYSWGATVYDDICLTLTQAGPLRFSALSLTATLLVNGTETPFFHLDADADLINTGGFRFFGNQYFSIGGEIPLNFNFFNYVDPSDPSAGAWYWADGYRDDIFSIGLTVTGTVVDTKDPVPLPSTLLLLGSGLGALVFYSGRKVVP